VVTYRDRESKGVQNPTRFECNRPGLTGKKNSDKNKGDITETMTGYPLRPNLVCIYSFFYYIIL